VILETGQTDDLLMKPWGLILWNQDCQGFEYRMMLQMAKTKSEQEERGTA
jgi:hypothetical protein